MSEPAYTILGRISVWGLIDELLARGLLYPETVQGVIYDADPESHPDGTIDIHFGFDNNEILLVEFPPEED